MITEIAVVTTVVYVGSLLISAFTHSCLYSRCVVAFVPFPLFLESIAPAQHYHASADEHCPICFEPLNAPNTVVRRTECGHVFCSSCLERWFMTNPVCPLCNHAFVDYLRKK